MTALLLAGILFYDLTKLDLSEPDDNGIVTIKGHYECVLQKRRICHGPVCITQFRPVVIQQKASVEAIQHHTAEIMADMGGRAQAFCLADNPRV